MLKEVKRTSKKALSLLLALVMIMTSVSVCFGTLAAGAETFEDYFPDHKEDAVMYLVKALNGDTIKKIAKNNAINGNGTTATTNTTTIKVDTYEEYIEARDTLIYIHKAIVTSTYYKNLYQATSDTYPGSCLEFAGLEANLLGEVKAANKNQEVSAEGKEFLDYLFNDSKAVKHSDYSKSKQTTNLVNTVNVYTTDYKGFLEAHTGDYTTVGDIELGYTYTMKMFGQIGKTNLNYVHSYKDSDGCDQSDTYYHHYMWDAEYPLDSNPPKADTSKSNTSIKNDLSAYVAYVNNAASTYTFDKFASMTLAEIEGVISNLDIETNTIKGKIADAGQNNEQEDMYNQLFPGINDRIDTIKKNADDAKDIAQFTELVNSMVAYMNANPDYGVFNWGGFDEATIKEAYKLFLEAYSSVLNNATVYDYFVRQGKLNNDYVTNFRDNVVVYDLEDLRLDKIDPLYNKYALSFPMEGGEEVSLAEKQVAYSELSGYINNVRSYTAQVQNAIFPEALDHLLDLQEKLECQVADCVVYFAENVGKDFSDVITEDLIAEVGTAKANLAALNNLLNSVDYDGNEVLLDSAFANANTFIEYLYSLLADRFTAQVITADEEFKALGSPDALDLTAFSALNVYLSAIEETILTFIDAEGKGALITQETRDTYNYLKATVLPKFEAFLKDRGFSQYTVSDLLILREDNADEFFRVNTDKDEDGVGEYKVEEEDVIAIIDILQAALKDPTVTKLLGDMINKDEDGNPTGEAFDLAGMLRKLIEENLYTDALLNTIIGFIYPAVANIFTDVWSTLPANLDLVDSEVVSGMKADIKANLHIGTVEDATAGLDMPLFPQDIADVLYAKYPQYKAVADVLTQADTAAKKLSSGVVLSPWNDEVLFTDKVDENGDVIVNEETGETTKVLNLVWGIDNAENKKAAFLNAADAALYGLKPLLFALLCNKPMEQFNAYIGYGEGKLNGVDASIITINNATLTLNSIDLTLKATANDGYNNVIAPLFEILGVKAPNASTFNYTVADVLDKGLLTPLETVIANLAANPIDFLLKALPNLMYAIEADLLLTKLDYLETVITYSAGVIADVDLNTADGVGIFMGMLSGIVEGMVGMPVDDGVIYGVDANDVYSNVDEPLAVKITGEGGFINLEEMLDGADLSSFEGIWNFLKGLVPMLEGAEAPNASYLATLGTLGTIDTVRTKKPYTYGGDGKAAYITANKADVLAYLIKWVLESGLLGGLVKEPSELIATIFSNLENSSGDAVAAIVELLNQQAYPAKEYDWFDGTIDGTKVTGNSAYEIYLNPNNDWTKEKAEYLYNNLDALLTAALTMAGVDLDLGATISGAIDGLLTDKTLTALAALLAKLDLNEMLNKDKTDEEKAKALDVNGLIKTYLGLDLAAIAAEYADIAAAKEADENYVYDFGVDAGTTTFAAALADMLAPLSDVLDFILDGGNLEITINGETIELLGAEGYNNAIVPLLEALGCTIETEGTSLEKTINALLNRIDALTTGDVIKNIIDLLPGVFYFITSNGLSTAVMNLLQPVLVIVDTIRPVFDVMDLISDIKVGDKTIAEFLGGELNIEKLDLAFIFDLLPNFIDLDLTSVEALIYDICNNIGVEYESASTLDGTFKKGAYTEAFDQADLLTVVLSFVLEWATIEDNAKALDEMLGTNGIIAGLNTVFAEAKIEYGTPEWMYWFKGDEAKFNKYVEGDEALPNTLASLTYPEGNDWTKASAEYFADNLATLVNKVIAMIEINGVKYENVGALLNSFITDYISADTINMILDMLKGVLANVDETLLGAGYLLDVDIVGLKNYTCTKEIATISEFVAELDYILDEYAPTIVNLLFFGDDIRLAKKADGTDTIVINGGEGYEKGLAMILEALGCELPEVATTETVLGALAARVEAILADPVNEVIELLPNLIYFLNANGAGVAVDNILAPVYAIIDKLAVLGVELDIAELLGFELKNLTLADILALVESKAGIDLSNDTTEILTTLCLGKIEKGTYIYKMTANRADTVTVVLTLAVNLLADEDFTNSLNIDVLNAIKTVFASVPAEYAAVEWQYVDGVTGKPNDYLNEIYGTDWDRATAEYLAENLPVLVDAVIGLIDENYDSLGEFLGDKVNVFTSETLGKLVELIQGIELDMYEEFLGAGIILNVDIEGLMNEYTVPADIDTVEEFAAELANILNTYAKGLVEWLLLGEDYTFFVQEAKVSEDMPYEYEAGKAVITLNGANGYSEGLALLLEALGVAAPAVVYTEGKLNTEATLEAVFEAIAARINAIFANPVEEVLALLPNVIYFLNSNGVATVIDNTIAAVTAVLTKLVAFGVELDINALVNLPKLMGIEGKGAKISLDNLTVGAIIEAVGFMLDLDLSRLNEVLNPFAIGSVEKYESISSQTAYKMTAAAKEDKADMITVILGAALRVVFENEANTAKIEEMIGTDILTAIKAVFEDVEITYTAPDWDYITTGNDYELDYPTNWTEETAEYVAAMLPEIADLVAGIIDNNYDSIEALLKDKVNVFTADTLNSIVGLLKNIIADMNKELLGVGVILDVDINGLLDYKCDKEFATVNDFAAELANILSTYIPGVIEWLLLGKDFTFFVQEDAQGDLGTMITINGANGYSEGLALLLEALGCQNLPTGKEATADVVAGVLDSVANLINAIFADPVTEVLALLPNLFYFLNTNGVAAVVDNTIAAVTALLTKLEAFGVKLDINELVNLPKLMGIEGKGASISLDNLSMAAILEAVGLMTGLKLGKLEDLLVGYDLGKLVEYDSVSTSVGTTFKMTYGDEYKVYDMITVIANAALIVFTDGENAEVVKGLIGEDIYKVITNFLATAEIEMQKVDWMYTDKVGTVFSAMERSEEYAGFTYGEFYKETHSEYIADNFPAFVDNVIGLLGLEYGKTLDEVLNNLIQGTIYKSSNVVAIRDALAGILDGIVGLELGGVNVGAYIAEVLNKAGIADLAAVANVQIPEFTADKDQFIASLCDVIEPLYPILKYVLADENISFFVAENGTEALVELNGAEGYAYGILPLLEALGCEGIIAPDAYYAAIDTNPDTLITSIIVPLLNKVDKIIAAPADEILNLLPNLVYFINSNGIDTVVKNTLNAVYAVLAKIEPIAVIDLYELIGIDLAAIDFEWILNKVLELLAGMGYEFEVDEIDYVSELTVGKLEQYTSLNGNEAYRMVYTPDAAGAGDKAEMVTTIERLIITFITDEANQAMVVKFLQDNLGMGAAGTKFVEGTIKVLADCAVNTTLGMEMALMATYYVFYGVDTGVQGTVDGLGNLSNAFNGLLDLVEKVNPDSYELLNKIFNKIDPGKDVFNPGTDGEDGNEGGIAQNGLVRFFQRIVTWFQNIGTWFKNLFSFDFLKR